MTEKEPKSETKSIENDPYYQPIDFSKSFNWRPTPPEPPSDRIIKEGKQPMKPPGILKPDKEHPLVGPVYTQIVHEWQLCPKCNGTGGRDIIAFMHPYTNLSTMPVTCDLCNGKKIISKVNGLPPQ